MITTQIRTGRHGPRPALVVAFAALAASSAAPQDLQGHPVGVVQRAHGIAEQGGVLSGGGADYKVTFGARGIELVPALGRRAAQSYPFRLALDSVRRGERELFALGTDRGTAPRRQLDAVVYDRAPGICERFAVRPDGVALSYRFERPLPGSGDLVVRLDVDTPLVARAHGDSPHGLLFAAAGIGGVRVGSVSGIDARGYSAAGMLRFDGNHLELVLPAVFVDRAAYPLVLDPLIGTELLVASGGDDIDPDVAYDATNDVYLVVWQREFSATDIDVRGQRVASSGSLVGSLLSLHSPATGLASHPTVANVNLTDRFLVAWQEGPSFFGPWDVRGACVHAASGAVSSTATLAGSPFDDIDPDAGSEATLIDDEALLVWEEQGTIYGAQVTCAAGSGPPVASGKVVISAGGIDKHKPAISKNGGTSGRHMVVYRHGDVGFIWGVEITVVDRNMNPLGFGFQSQWSALDDPDHPDVDGDGTSFLIVWDDAGLTGVDRDVFCERVDFDPITSLVSTVIAQVPVAAQPFDDERSPVVAFLGPKYVVAWSERAFGAGPLSHEVMLQALDANCTTCETQRVLGVGGRAYDHDPQIASRVSGGSTGDHALVVFAAAHAAPPYASEVRGQLIEAIGGGGLVTSLGGGCGTGGTAGTNGPFAIGNLGFRFTLNGADPAATVATLVLNAPVPPIACGACQLTPPLMSASVPIVAGRASLGVPLSCNLALVGSMFQVQWRVAVTAASPCSLLPNMSFSNRLNATIGM